MDTENAKEFLDANGVKNIVLGISNKKGVINLSDLLKMYSNQENTRILKELGKIREAVRKSEEHNKKLIEAIKCFK